MTPAAARRLGGALAGATLAVALAAVAARAEARDAVTFSPERFFSGRSFGDGVVTTPVSQYRLHVESVGRVERDGLIVLDQTITQKDQEPETRQWRIKAAGGGRYAGTLSDAAGGVEGRVKGRVLVLAFFTKAGLAVEQRLELQPGDQVALNHMTIRILGLPLASLEERITKR